jgi:ATP-dependent Lhr-like helicase
MTMQKTNTALWIESMVVENLSSAAEFLVSLIDFGNRNKVADIIILDCPEELKDQFTGNGFTFSGKTAILGNGQFVDMISSDLIDVALRNYSSYRGISGSVLERINNRRLGFRDPIEAHYHGIKENDLDSYYVSNLIFNFNGPFSVMAKATPETISIYRTIRKTPMDATRQKILKVIMEDPADEKEISLLTGIGISHVKASVKELLSKCIVARDHDGNLRFILERYEKDESVRIMITEVLNALGFISTAIYEDVTHDPDLNTFNTEIQLMLTSGKLKKVFIKDNREPYFFLELPKESKRAGSDKIRIISQKDFLYLCFRDYIKANLGGSKTFLIEKDMHLVGSVVFRKVGRKFEIKNVIGNGIKKDELKRELSILGYSTEF